MTAQRWLQIHVITLCLLGSLFVALSTRDLTMPAAVLISGILSVLFTDIQKWVRLNRLLGNLAAIGAVLYSLHDFLGNISSDSQLGAIATLLVYLQIILFFQDKNARLYWQIILLSLLQVVVGAALHLGYSFGLLLLAYTVVAMSTLVIFFIERETDSHAALPEPPPSPASGNRWKTLLGRPAEVRIEGRPQDLSKAFLSIALVRQIALLTCGALLFAAAFFYAAPRHPAGSWNGSGGRGQSQTGFSRSMELMQMGELLQNNSEVMKVRLLDPQGKHLRRLDPYFAGEALPRYEVDTHGKGRWSPRQFGSSLASVELIQERADGGPPPPAPGAFTTVEISIIQSPEHSLFTIMPAYGIPDITDKSVRMDATSSMLFLDLPGETAQKVECSVATTGIRGGRQLSIAPENRRLGSRDPRVAKLHLDRFQKEIEACRQWNIEDQRRFAGIQAEATRIIASRSIQSREPIAVSRALEDYFVSSGNNAYSLNLNVPRDAELDPIEDFVVNHRPGHCQYFASALVMMLRSQGLPARMVVGYRGSDYNELGNFYLVRQRNAHAWVEVYLRPDQIPEHEPTGGDVGAAGAWLRLDPTPGQDSASQQPYWSRARDWLDYFDSLWTDYVVGLNQKKQQDTIYRALSPPDVPASAWLQPESLQETFRTVAAWLGIHIGKDGKAGWSVIFDWRAALTAAVLTIIVLLLSRVARWLLPRIDWSPLWFWRRPPGHRSVVAFYNRLEDLLAKRGSVRRLAETPREYVDRALRELSLSQGDALHRIVAMFYRVRFGGVKLEESDSVAIEQALSTLQRTGQAAMK